MRVKPLEEAVEVPDLGGGEGEGRVEGGIGSAEDEVSEEFLRMGVRVRMPHVHFV